MKNLSIILSLFIIIGIFSSCEKDKLVDKPTPIINETTVEPLKFQLPCKVKSIDHLFINKEFNITSETRETFHYNSNDWLERIDYSRLESGNWKERKASRHFEYNDRGQPTLVYAKDSQYISLTYKNHLLNSISYHFKNSSNRWKDNFLHFRYKDGEFAEATDSITGFTYTPIWDKNNIGAIEIRINGKLTNIVVYNESSSGVNWLRESFSLGSLEFNEFVFSLFNENDNGCYRPADYYCNRIYNSKNLLVEKIFNPVSNHYDKTTIKWDCP